jgi:hypothetical protein
LPCIGVSIRYKTSKRRQVSDDADADDAST